MTTPQPLTATEPEPDVRCVLIADLSGRLGAVRVITQYNPLLYAYVITRIPPRSVFTPGEVIRATWRRFFLELPAEVWVATDGLDVGYAVFRKLTEIADDIPRQALRPEFDRLYAQHERLVRMKVKRIVWAKHDEDDVCQEFWLKIWKTLPLVDIISHSEQTKIICIQARHRAIEHIRRMQRIARDRFEDVSIHEDALAQPWSPWSPPDIDQILQAVPRHELLRRGLQLRAEGWSRHAVCEIIGVSRHEWRRMIETVKKEARRLIPKVECYRRKV